MYSYLKMTSLSHGSILPTAKPVQCADTVYGIYHSVLNFVNLVKSAISDRTCWDTPIHIACMALGRNYPEN